MAKIVSLDLARAVASRPELGNPAGIDVVTDHGRALPGKCDGNRQPDISEPDDGELSTV